MNKKTDLPSLKDIAEELGVSIATVSKSLNNHSDVSEKTKEKVVAKAAEMGYQTNLVARMLRSGRSNDIALVFADAAKSGLTHNYFSYVLESFRDYASKRGYDMTFISHTDDETYAHHCQRRGVDGVAVVCVDFEFPEVRELVNSRLPVVTIDHVFNNRTAILSDNAQGIKSLVTYAYDMGHRKIAYIHGFPSAVTQERLSSFHRTCFSLGLSIPDEYLPSADYRDTVGCYEATRQLLLGKNPPTCIMYPDDFSALGGIEAIHRLGLRIPEDISIIGYDGMPMASVLTPKLTTWKQNTRAIGEKAAEKLIEAIEQPKMVLIERIVTEGSLVEGESVAKIL